MHSISMFENKMRFKLVLLCLNIKTIIMISFSFFAIYLPAPLTHATFRLYAAEKVVIIDFDDVLRLFVHSFQSHFHSNYRQYFNWPELRSITLWLSIRSASQSLKLCSLPPQTVQIVTKFRIWYVHKLPNKVLRNFGIRKKKWWGRMKIYEVYLLLFRKCFHIRYPRIKSLFSSIFDNPKA